MMKPRCGAPRIAKISGECFDTKYPEAGNKKEKSKAWLG